MIRSAILGLALAALLPALTACGRAETAPTASAPPHDRAWVELTGQGAQVRLVTAADACPEVRVDGRRLPMQARAKPDADFPVTVCQAVLPKDARRASLKGLALPLPPREPKRIVIFGDTGCRLKGWDIQNCDNPADWPFATVARLAAAHHPDLVIHVGDYYYRESPCPAGRSGCSGSPWGDNWTTWNADFFRPAGPLLRTAPWVMVRGNHEDCERGGPGWFRLLDGAWTARACPATSAPMAIDLEGLDLYVLDSSGTSDGRAPPAKVAAFAAQLDLIRQRPPRTDAWILTHRPIWGLAPVAKLGPLGPLEVPINATEQAAARGRPLAGVQMVVSGHIHHFASFSFLGNRPAQLIVGTGGGVGSPADSPRYLGDVVTLDGMKARRFGFDRYGFLVLDRTATGWAGDFYDTAGRPVAACALAGRALDCRPA